MLIDYLALRDVACPVCKYNLRGLTQPRCPECGRQLELSVRATDGPLGLWIAALVATLPATPFGVVLICALFINHGWGTIYIHSGTDMWNLTLAIYSILAIPAAVALIAGRRRWSRMPVGRQRVLSAIPIAFDLAAIISLIVAINL